MRCRQCGFTYDLGMEETARRAESGLQAFEAAVRATSDDRAGRRPAPDVWSVNAYSAHMAEAANVIYERVRNIATQDHPTLEWYDESEAVERGRYDDRPAVESLAPLRESVEAFRRCLESLPPEAWDRTGVHTRAGEVRLSDIAQDMPHELEHHAGDVARIGGSAS
jgi:hypothetical protein